jgi:DNA-binding response OmpR family regulator
MKRRILLVDDEVAVLLTLKAVLEISDFDVDTAASAREGKSKLRTREYDMVITDMRMESESAGEDVIAAARAATYQPAIALLTAFPVNDENWQNGGADKLLVKPMQTRILLQQIEQLFASHEAKRAAGLAAPVAIRPSAAKALDNGAAVPVKNAVAKRTAAQKLPAKIAARKPVAKAAAPVKAAKKSAKAAAKKSPAK